MSDVSILLKLTVDANTRKITIPNNGTIFGVVGDVEINRVMFSVPRYYSGFDMKDFVARVNYVNPNGEMNFYESSDMAEVDDTITFSWLMSSDVTKYAGDVRFSIKLYKVSGNTYTKSFNTTTGIGKVLEGLDVEKQVTPEQQTTLLSKLETDIKASIDEYVNNQVTKNVNAYIENNVQKKVDAVVQEELAELKKDSVVQQVETNRTDIAGIKGGIVVQQATQPTSDTTQIWVDTSDEEEIEVPDMEEFNSLKDETNSLKEDVVNTKDGLSNKSYTEKAQFEMGYISGDNGEKGNNNINARSKIIHLNIGDKYKILIEKGNCVLHLYNNGIWQKYLSSSVDFCNEGYGTITVNSSEWDVTITKECDVCFVVNRNNNAEITDIAQAYDIITISKLYNYKRLDKIEDDLGKNNYWEGKKIVWFGTSIPAGVVHAGDDNGVNSYPIQVGDMLGAKVYNESVGSSAIRIGDYNSITSDDPNGYSGVPATCCLFSLSGTVDEKRKIISDWAVWKNKFKYGVDEIDSIINSGTVQSRIFDRSYEVKLSKYLNGGEVGTCDLYVIDHGYNDAGNKNGVDYSDLIEVPPNPFDRTYFIGAMNYIINKIKTDNFRASICIISHYNDEGVFKELVEAQRYIADYWNIPFIEIFNKMGFSTSAKITINGESKTLKDWWLPDGIHPSSDVTGAALEHYANVLYPLIRDIR